MATEEQATRSGAFNVKEAVRIARDYARELYPDDQLRNLRLEEIELTTDEGCWNVTLGWTDPGATLGPAGAISAMMDPGRQPRIYKVFQVDARTGAVRSMKIRETS